MFTKLAEFLCKPLRPVLNLGGRINPLFAVPFLEHANQPFTFASEFNNARSYTRNRIGIFLNANNLCRTLSTQFAHCAIKVFKFVCAKCAFNLSAQITNFCFKFVDCRSLCFTFKRLRGFTHLRLQVYIFAFKLSNLFCVFFSRLCKRFDSIASLSQIRLKLVCDASHVECLAILLAQSRNILADVKCSLSKVVHNLRILIAQLSQRLLGDFGIYRKLTDNLILETLFPLLSKVFICVLLNFRNRYKSKFKIRQMRSPHLYLSICSPPSEPNSSSTTKSIPLPEIKASISSLVFSRKPAP